MADACALGMDIGGTKIAAAIVEPGGGISGKVIAPTPGGGGAREILRAAVESGRRVLETARARGTEVAVLGVGTAGHVDHERGNVTYASENLPGWAGVELARQLRTALRLPVSVDNDANTMALGEGRFGAGRGLRDVLYVTVGTGIGGALVLDGRLRRGATWTAGELGHMTVDRDGTRHCSCGRPGHLEAYASGPTIAERYRALTGLDGRHDLRSIAAEARNGDPIANAVIAEGASILGLALGGLLDVIDTQALIVGGGVAELGEVWWSPLEATLRANPMPGPASIRLSSAELGVDAGLIGAAWLALREHAPELVDPE